MISTVEIRGYRRFDNFEMSGLGRINLLVGPNNGGKTSVLEAIFLLASGGDPASMWQILIRRGEHLVVGTNPSSLFRTEADVRHLFRGHEIQQGCKILLRAQDDSIGRRELSVRLEQMSPQERADLRHKGDSEASAAGLALRVSELNGQFPIPLSRYLGIREESVSPRRSREGATPTFIAAESLNSDELSGLWNGVQLTPAEALVLQAVQFIDPDVERVAAQVTTVPTFYRSGSRGGFIVKLNGADQPVPIGSLGDGMWRILALAIAVTQSRGGVLLVDEIDTGLHHSVMSEMWRFLFNTAKELDVQVFATTHSYDCVYSLANVCADADQENQISVQRIEPEKSKAISYAQNQIRIAAEREIEVR